MNCRDMYAILGRFDTFWRILGKQRGSNNMRERYQIARLNEPMNFELNFCHNY